MSDLSPGLRAESTHVVTAADTALSLGSGDVAVYATPALVALFERAAVAAVRGVLDDATMSVGTRLEVEHLAPSAVGATVHATATLTEVAGRRLTFKCDARDAGRLVGRCVHQRVIVDRASFGG